MKCDRATTIAVLAAMLSMLTGTAGGAGAEPSGRIYVSNEKSSTITILDAATGEVIGGFETCARPRGMHFNLDRTQFFVGCADDNVIAVYDAASANLVQRIRKMEDRLGLDTDDIITINIFGGLGGGYLIEELISGANGAMTGFAYPRLLVETVSKWNAGQHDEAADFFYRHVPLMRFEFQPGIGMAIRKEILKRRGALSHAGIRAPGAELDEPTKASLDRVLKWLDL